MLRLIGLALSIGLADSLNPSTVGPALFLAGGPRPIRSVVRFTLGTFAVLFLGGAILTVGPGEAILALVPRPGRRDRYILETVAGAAMLVLAAVLWFRRERLENRESGGNEHSSARSPLVLGATISAVEFPTAFPYFAVIIAVVGSGLDLGRQLLLILLYNLCFVAPLLLIALLLRVVGDRATEIIHRVREWLHGHWPPLVAAVALVAGVFVVTLGITGLTSGVHGQVGKVSRSVRKVISQ